MQSSQTPKASSVPFFPGFDIRVETSITNTLRGSNLTATGWRVLMPGTTRLGSKQAAEARPDIYVARLRKQFALLAESQDAPIHRQFKETAQRKDCRSAGGNCVESLCICAQRVVTDKKEFGESDGAGANYQTAYRFSYLTAERIIDIRFCDTIEHRSFGGETRMKLRLP